MALPDRPVLGGGEAYRQKVDRPRGGGPARVDRTLADAQALLRPQLDVAESAIAQLSDEQRGERVILQATMSPRFIANSHYPSKAFEEADLKFVGTRATDLGGTTTKTLLLAATDESLSALRHVLDHPVPAQINAQEELLKLEAVALPDARAAVRIQAERAVTTGDGRIGLDAVLHPAVSRDGERSLAARETLVARFLAWATEHDAEVLGDAMRVIGGLVFVPLLAAEASARAIAEFNGLRVLRDLAPVSSLPLDGTARALQAGTDPEPPTADRALTSERICVFDGPLQSNHPYLDRFVKVTDLVNAGTQTGVFAYHGTWVTSAALHGPIVPLQTLATPPAEVDHVVIAPRNGDPSHMPWALQQITSVVRSRRPKLVNISVAPAHDVDDDDEPHDWTIVLDELAHELGVLFIVAVGNCKETEAPRRIQVPADMVNGLAVGACDQRSPSHPWDRASYSHVGPGRAGARIRPSGVGFGGTPTAPFHVAHPTDEISAGRGTSLSAPLVARSLAGLCARLGDRGSATALRAFATHFADPHPAGTNDEVGHGRIPEDFEPLLECGPDEVTVLYQDELARDEVVSVPVPVPAALPGGNYELRWTLAFASPVTAEDAFEYTAAGIEPSFRPDVLATTMRKPGITQSKNVHLGRDTAKIAALQAEGWRVTGTPRTRPLRADRHERNRRLDGKWESLVRGEDRLRAGSLNSPVLWLDYLARADGEIWRGGDVPALPFSLLITVKGPAGSGIYSSVRNDLSLLVDVPIDLQIDVDVSENE